MDGEGAAIGVGELDTATLTWSMVIPTMEDNDARYIELTGDADGRGLGDTHYFFLGFGLAGDYIASAISEAKIYWGVEWDKTNQDKWQIKCSDHGSPFPRRRRGHALGHPGSVPARDGVCAPDVGERNRYGGRLLGRRDLDAARHV